MNGDDICKMIRIGALYLNWTPRLRNLQQENGVVVPEYPDGKFIPPDKLLAAGRRDFLNTIITYFIPPYPEKPRQVRCELASIR